MKIKGKLVKWYMEQSTMNVPYRGNPFQVASAPAECSFTICSDDIKQYEYFMNKMKHQLNAKEDYEIDNFQFLGCWIQDISAKDLNVSKSNFSYDVEFYADHVAVSKSIKIIKHGIRKVEFKDENGSNSHTLFNAKNDKNTYDHIINGEKYDRPDVKDFWNILIKRGWRKT